MQLRHCNKNNIEWNKKDTNIYHKSIGSFQEKRKSFKSSLFNRFFQGEEIYLTCMSNMSQPAASLSWTVNNNPVQVSENQEKNHSLKGQVLHNKNLLSTTGSFLHATNLLSSKNNM